jgi:hypothetical protein
MRVTKTKRQEAIRAAAELASMFAGATSRGNTVYINTNTPTLKPPRVPPPPMKKLWGLKAAGGDTTWCSKKPETHEERHLKEESEKLRRQLKWEAKQNATE